MYILKQPDDTASQNKLLSEASFFFFCWPLLWDVMYLNVTALYLWQYLQLYMGIVCAIQQSVFTCRQISLHCHVCVCGCHVWVCVQELNPGLISAGTLTHYSLFVSTPLQYAHEVLPVCLGSRGYTAGPEIFGAIFLHVYTRARPCMHVLACVCVNSGPPAHFTHRQTSKAVWINPACRAALHAIRNFTSLPLQQHQTYIPIHIEMNRWEFCRTPNRHPLAEKR